MRLKLIVFLITCFGVVPLWSQSTISGTVTDDSNIPLGGVNVTVEGTGIGTSTDFDGNYTIKASKGEKVSFSYIGFKSTAVVVAAQLTIDIVLVEDASALDEVVVVGYGALKKRDVMSSITKVKSEVIERAAGASFTDALQGASSGLQVTTNGGDPTAATRILIRGTGSISTASEPLVIVDGIPIASGGTSPLNYLSPADIDNISVLKDAAATSIYGSRGSNGVILITTKTGTKGQSSLTFSSESGVNNVINDLELATADEWRGLVSQGRSNSGLDPATNVIASQSLLVDRRQDQRYLDENLYETGNTDWVDKLKQDGYFTQYSLAASAGTDKASYYVSGQYRSQEGTLQGQNYDRYTGRLNLDFQVTDYLKIGTRYTIVHEDNDLYNNQGNAIDFNDRVRNRGVATQYSTLYNTALPIFPETYANGDTFEPLSSNSLTYLLDQSINSRTQKKLRNEGSVFVTIEPIKDLLFNFNGGITNTDIRDNQKYGSRAGVYTDDELLLTAQEQVLLDRIYDGGSDRIVTTTSNALSYNLSSTVSYSKVFKESHNFSALLGVEQNHSQSRRTTLDFEDAASLTDPTELGTPIRDGDQLIEVQNIINADVRLFSQFARLNYNFDNKYYFQGTVRRDGSSKFTPGDRFAIFPSASAGWIASSEDFYTSETLNYLKVRGGVGKTGNANIGSFLFFDSYQTWPNYPDRTGAFVLSGLGTNPIEWEKSTTIDTAVEFGLFNNRVTGSIGYYNTKTTDLLLTFPISYSVGVYTLNGEASSLANVGSIRNTGIEFEVSSLNVANKDFSWSTNFNITTNKNEVEELYLGFDNSDPTAFSFGNYTGLNIGSKLGEYFLPEFAGYDANGNPLIIDIETGDAVLNTATANLNNRVLQGKSGLPTFYGGLGNTFSYKGLSLDVLFTFQGGHYILDQIGLDNIGNGTTVLRQSLVSDSYSSDNQDSYFSTLSWNGQSIDPTGGATEAISTISTQKLHKGDMIRLRNITLGYDLKKGMQKLFNNDSFIKDANLFVKLQNVATFSKFDILDPETLNSGEAQARNLGQGVVSGVPAWQVMTSSLGLNLTF